MKILMMMMTITMSFEFLGDVTSQEIVDQHHDDVKALTAGPITSTTSETDARVIKAPCGEIVPRFSPNLKIQPRQSRS